MERRVLGIDVAKSWKDTGSAEVVFTTERVVEVKVPALTWPKGEPTAVAIAAAIDEHARQRGIIAVSLDGPQGWRDPSTPEGTPGVGRRCELACHTPGKVAHPGKSYPSTYLPWCELSIAVFDELLRKPGVVLANEVGAMAPESGYLVLECFPTSAWRSSGLASLPAKSKKPAIEPYAAALEQAYGLPPIGAPGHDDLQAVIAALTAVGAAGGPVEALPMGVPAFTSTCDGAPARFEGLIWNVAPRGTSPVQRPARLPAPQPTRPRAAAASGGDAGAGATVAVTQKVLNEIHRSGLDSAMQIAIRGVEGGTKRSPLRLEVDLDGHRYKLVLGDTYAFWRSHQTEETLPHFEELFAALADAPDTRVAVEIVEMGAA